MIVKKVFAVLTLLIVSISGFGPAALAQSGRIGKPADGQMGFQEPASPIMEQLTGFHNLLLIIISVITAIIFLLLLWVMIRYNRKANPEPSKTSHNTFIEIIWTVAPIIILIVIAIPSFRLLYYQDVIPEADIVLKATGHQWNWTYEYPDEGGLSFDAIMIPASYYGANLSPDDARDKQAMLSDLQNMLGRSSPPEIFRLFDTDTRVVVPVNKVVKVLVTADDVLHAWTVPAFGIKVDAVPGRVNETWFQATEIGTFYGQCSELCGKDHSFMPIVVEVVSEADYQAWLGRAKSVYAMNGTAPVRLAAADVNK